MEISEREASVVREREVDGVIILTLERDVKGAGEITLRRRIAALVAAGRLQIIVDLQHVPYIDSTDLGRLIRAHIAVRQAGGRARVCNVAPKVMTLFKLTRLDTVLDLYPTEAEALAAVRGSPVQTLR
jgi:anti-sigma B factor antagonist